MIKQLRMKSLLLLCALIVGSLGAWGETVVLFHETFGDNPSSARAWSDTYSVKSGVSAVYSGITSYTVSNVKQGKNTTGSTGSGLNQSSQGTDAYIIIGPLNVANYNSLNLTYQWKAASIKGTYTTKAYYATSSGGEYTEVSGTGNGATSFVERPYSLPAAAQVSTLYLKIVFNTSNAQAIIDEVELTGVENVVVESVKKPSFSVDEGVVDYGTTVTLSQQDSKTIKYTTDGTTPTASSETYSSPFTITNDITIKAIAVDGVETSSVATATYTVRRPDSQVFGEASSNVYYGSEVTLSAADGCVIKYTTDDSEPDESSATYSSAIKITATTTIKAIAIDTHGLKSPIASAKYSIKAPDAPKILPIVGYVVSGTVVTLSVAEGCFISYTTDGTDPASSATAILSDANTENVTIDAAKTIRAIALDGGANESVEASASYILADADAMTDCKTTFDATSGELGNDISFESHQGEASTAPAIYNDGIRLYQNGGYITLTAPDGFKIIGLTIGTTASYAKTKINYKLDENNAFELGESVELARDSYYFIDNLDNQSVSIYCLGEDKNSRLEIGEISVTYMGNGTVTLASACTDGSKYYGTYSNSHAFVVPDGLTVSEINVADSKLTVENYATGDVVPANTGVMVSATTSGEKTIKFSGRTGSSVLDSDNMLKASGDADKSAVEMNEANTSFYRLTMHDGKYLGFYWGAENGAAFAIAANKAYLAVPVGASARIAGFNLFENEGEATSIEGVKTVGTDAPVFNLNGQRVNSNAKGLLIKNGKKFMNR